MRQDIQVLDRVKSAYVSLRPLERRVADYVLSDPENWGNVELTPGSPPEFQTGDEDFLGEIQTLSETSGDIQSVTVENGKVTALSYENGNVTCDYLNGEDAEGSYTIR